MRPHPLPEKKKLNDEQAQANLQLALAWIDAMHRGKIARPRPPR
jgi:hypothetical protein